VGLYGGCLGGDYWLLVFFSFPFVEHKYNEIRDVYYLNLLHGWMDGH